MPVPGLSLVGFMDEQSAVQYLTSACVPPDPTPAALTAEWNAAKGKLGEPIPSAGQPEVLPLPDGHDAYVAQLKVAPWLQDAFNPASGWEIKLVEIDPLLAFQPHVDTSRSAMHCGGFAAPLPIADLLTICLPAAQPNIPYQIIANPPSILIQSRSLNLRMKGAGIFGGNIAGIVFDAALEHVQVSRFQDRCYLSNGYHRIFGLRAIGVTHVPCLFRDATSPDMVGIKDNTFPLALLESADPPTCAHFCTARAHPVSLRIASRVIHVTWGEHILPNE